MKRLAIVMAAILSLSSTAHAQVTWICSTEDKQWQTMDAPEFVQADATQPPEIRIAPRCTFQTIDGFRGRPKKDTLLVTLPAHSVNTFVVAR